ncbi:uncharacterized protein N0V89_009163 [Didymosphaeria variabile]|uniref:Major facilitator superfamily (MFS) profile domain-containing protein n=1 Tax=Didymosphaeria variabile TaxID=1932322 RepID=A0A9W8XCW1_9PLEO|nr:uncharacterized protein N0V89_009163 [Didymosphaeria variabile]KAJ4347793.1 hypothetical protein N0V89_009163 [Didymosphaeria variabile]
MNGTDTVTTVIAGVLTDRLRSKSSAFLFGMVTMIASSLMFFLGEHLAVVIAARALQGLSASFVWVSGLALLNAYVKTSYVGTAMGYISVGTAAGEISGPIVGGAMYEHAGHFAVLGLVCGILGVDIVLRLLLVDKPSDEQQQRNGNPADEEEPLLGGVTQRGADSTNTRVAPQDVIEPKHINILGLQLDKDLCATYYATCIVGTIRYAFESALVIFVIKRFSWSISTSGVILFAFLCPAALGPLIGSLTTTYGPRRLSVILFSVVTVSLIALGLLTQPVTATKASFVIALQKYSSTMSAGWYSAYPWLRGAQ